MYTFIPLLHLSNENKVDLSQDEHFGEINITLPEKGLDLSPEDSQPAEAKK